METVNAATLKDFVIIALALGGFALAAWATFQPRQPTNITPDPLRIEKLDKFATRDFCESKNNEVHRRLDQHEKEIVQLRLEAREDRQNGEAHATRRSADLHGKIESVRTDLNDKIDAMPERIIDLLNHLGKLK